MYFQVGKPVSGINFTGRENEIRDLLQLLKNGQSAVLIAPRRYGKTSVILNVFEQLKRDKIFTSYIDIFSIADIKRLAEQLTNTILENKKLEKLIISIKKNVGDIFKNIEFKSTVEEYEFLLKFGQTEINQWELLENTLDFAEKFAFHNSKLLVIGVDEFGDIEKLGSDNLVKLLRSKMQQQKNVVYLFSGSYESVMNHLFTTVRSPFYRFARIIKLGNISKKSFEAFYISKLIEFNINYNLKLINLILDYTKGHPYYSSLFLQQWLFNGNVLVNSDIDAFFMLLDTVLDIEKPYLEKLWEDVSSQKDQRMLIVSLAEGNKPYAARDGKRINISRVINKLEQKSLIIKSGRNWVFTDPLFETWIRKVVLKE